MDPQHKRLLNQHKLDLLRNLFIDEEFLSVFRPNNILTEELQEKIQNQSTTQGKVGFFVDTLQRRGKRAFGTLIKALNETNQEHIVRMLCPEEFDNEMKIFDEIDDDWMKNVKDIAKEIEKDAEMNLPVSPMSDKHKSILHTQSEVYQMTPGRKALAFVINNKKFFVFPNRDGSNHDLENMKRLFGNLHFEVIDKSDQTATEIKDVVKTAQEQLNGGHYDLFVFCIMSHGAKGVVFGKDEKAVNIYNDILAEFNDQNCPRMAGKPKLFFIQACQGSTGSTQPSNGADANPDANQQSIDRTNVIWQSPDILLAFGTAEGYEAWRHRDLGSWFIRAIVYVFSHRAYRDHVVNMMTQVCNVISQIKAKDSYTQIAERKSTLTKKLYFYR